MNKKARLYGINRIVPFTKIKDFHQKSNQKQVLNRSTEHRKKYNQIQEQNSEKHQGSKLVLNKSKKVKLDRNIYNNEKQLKIKEYSNTIGTDEKAEDNQISEKDFFKETDNEERYETDSNRKNLLKIYNNDKIERKYQKSKINKSRINREEEGGNDNASKDKEDDIIYRTMYKSSKKNINKVKEKEEKIKENKDKELDFKDQSYKDEKSVDNNKLGITMEQTDNLHYNKDDKKIHLNAYNSKNKRRKSSIKKSRPKYDYKDSKSLSNNYSENENIYSPKTYGKRNFNYIYDLNQERVIDMFIIDDDYDIKFLTKTKKKINRKNNIFREIIIENYGPNMPIKKDEFIGFIFIRKSKGKKMYKLELPDDLEKINEIFKNEEIMIKNQIIQIIPEQKLLAINTQTQNELKKTMNEKNLEKEIERDKEIIKDKERQITLLKNKIEDLNNTIKKQTKQITTIEKEMKNAKLASEQIKDSFQNLENENKSLKSQLQAYKMKRKSLQMQMEEGANQSLQEMKDRIQKYKNELRKPSLVEEKEKENRRKSNIYNQNANNMSEKNKNKNNNRNSIYSSHSVDSEKKEEFPIMNQNVIDKKEEDGKNNEEEEYEDDYNYDMYDEKDPKARKMKKAMARFRKKYKDIIIENKKNLKIKEKEEKEDLEKKELEGINQNLILKEKEEKEKEEKERKEKENKEKEEKERKEKERKEKEKKEKEEREKKERERKEKERKEKEEKERKEKERKEKERKEKEEKERKEKERKEKEKKEREEKERKEKEKEKKVLPNKLAPNNFAKMLADKMKFGPMGAAPLRKPGGGVDNNTKPTLIIEKKVDVVNLIEGQPFKRKTKKKPTRIMFVE